MTVVIDVGCARYGGDHSVERLIETYRPDMLIGYDPNPAIEDSYRPTGPENGCVVYLRREAAWTYDGEVGFVPDGLNGWISDDVLAEKVPCVDLARVIEEMPEGPVILKLDCEGSEYELLTYLLSSGATARLSLLVVEWHCHECGRGGGTHKPDCSMPAWYDRDSILIRLDCPVEAWTW